MRDFSYIGFNSLINNVNAINASISTKQDNLIISQVAAYVSYSGGWHINNAVSCAAPGYRPIMAIQNGFAGSPAASNIQFMGCSLSGTTISFSYYSSRADSGYLNMYFYVIYVKS